MGIGQLVIAALMLYSLLQTRKSLDYTRTQIESTKRPLLEIASFEQDKLHLRNMGGTEIHDVQIVAYMAANYRPNEDVTRTQFSAVGPRAPILKQSLRPSDELAIDFSQLTFLRTGVLLEHDEGEVFAVVFRYYRAADRRPFHKIMSFIRIDNGESSSPRYLYFSLYVMPGSALAGPNRPVHIKLRKTVEDLCADNFNLRKEDGDL